MDTIQPIIDGMETAADQRWLLQWLSIWTSVAAVWLVGAISLLIWLIAVQRRITKLIAEARALSAELDAREALCNRLLIDIHDHAEQAGITLVNAHRPSVH